MQPAKKHPNIDKFITNFFGGSRIDAIEADKCVSCSKEVIFFRDELSKKEYTISGLCQICQDSVFGID